MSQQFDPKPFQAKAKAHYASQKTVWGVIQQIEALVAAAMAAGNVTSAQLQTEVDALIAGSGLPAWAIPLVMTLANSLISQIPTPAPAPMTT